jgi:hypothetical protein
MHGVAAGVAVTYAGSWQATLVFGHFTATLTGEQQQQQQQQQTFQQNSS